MKQQKPKNGRAKGAGFELRIAKLFSAALGIRLRRTPMSGGWSHDNPDVAGDLVCIEGSFPYCVECKCAEDWRLESLFTSSHKWFDDWWGQLLRECPDGRIPLLVFSRARMPVFVAMRCDLTRVIATQAVLYVYTSNDTIAIIRLEDFLPWAASHQ